MQFTACYTKLDDGGYMGQLLEWTNVITSGKDLEDCEEMLKDAAREMAIVYYEDDQEIPQEELIVKPINIPLEEDSFMSERTKHYDIYSKEKGRYVPLKHDENFDAKTANALFKEAGITQTF